LLNASRGHILQSDAHEGRNGRAVLEVVAGVQLRSRDDGPAAGGALGGFIAIGHGLANLVAFAAALFFLCRPALALLGLRLVAVLLGAAPTAGDELPRLQCLLAGLVPGFGLAGQLWHPHGIQADEVAQVSEKPGV